MRLVRVGMETGRIADNTSRAAASIPNTSRVPVSLPKCFKCLVKQHLWHRRDCGMMTAAFMRLRAKLENNAFAEVDIIHARDSAKKI